MFPGASIYPLTATAKSLLPTRAVVVLRGGQTATGVSFTHGGDNIQGYPEDELTGASGELQ